MKPKDLKAGLGKPAAPATSEASQAEAFVSADAWIEHLEEEMEPACSADSKQDLDLVLKNSAEDAALFASLTKTRAAVASLKDDVALPESGEYYDRLHAQIMAAIEEDASLNGTARPQRPASKRRKILLSSMFSAFGLTMIVVILAALGLNHSRSSSAPLAQADASRESAVEENFERKIAMIDSRSGAAFARDMGSFESEEDFLTETAAARLKQLSAKQAEALLRRLRR